MPSFIVKDSVALVTGTNKKNGIGRAIVRSLLSHGASKVYATARDASQLDDLVAEQDGKVVAVALDVTDRKALADLFVLYPDVTLVVNNAGYSGMLTSITDVDLSDLEMQVNYVAPMAIGKSFAPIFASLKSHDEDGSEHPTRPSALVNINSGASFVNVPINATYSASKAAAHSLTQAQRRDLSNSLVIGVYPGLIATDMTVDFDVEMPAPSTVGEALVMALEQGDEELFPDPMSKEVYNEWKANPKALQEKWG